MSSSSKQSDGKDDTKRGRVGEPDHDPGPDDQPGAEKKPETAKVKETWKKASCFACFIDKCSYHRPASSSSCTSSSSSASSKKKSPSSSGDDSDEPRIITKKRKTASMSSDGGVKGAMNVVSSTATTLLLLGNHTRTFDSGANVQISGGQFYVNGKLVDKDDLGNKVSAADYALAGKVEIHIYTSAKDNNVKITGDSAPITVHGSCHTARTDSGDVTVNGGVTGGVTTDSGDVTVSGDVSGKCKSDSGSITVLGRN